MQKDPRDEESQSGSFGSSSGDVAALAEPDSDGSLSLGKRARKEMNPNNQIAQEIYKRQKRQKVDPE